MLYSLQKYSGAIRLREPSGNLNMSEGDFREDGRLTKEENRCSIAQQKISVNSLLTRFLR